MRSSIHFNKFVIVPIRKNANGVISGPKVCTSLRSDDDSNSLTVKNEFEYEKIMNATRFPNFTRNFNNIITVICQNNVNVSYAGEFCT